MDPAEGDRVRVDIPDETDPDYDLYHGREGIVVERLQEDADEVTGNEGDSLFDGGPTVQRVRSPASWLLPLEMY